jgi:hypothetical protein
MAIAAIYYNGKTLTFPTPPQPGSYAPYAFQQGYPRGVIPAYASSRVSKNLNIASDMLVSLKIRLLENIADATLKRTLYQWSEWAAQGKPWQFSMDTTKTLNTTITQGQNVGDQTVVVASTSSLVTGDQCILRTATQLALVKVTNISGLTLTLAETLDFAFPSGARFRHERYYPARLAPTKLSQHIIQERPPLHYDVELDFFEDVN